VLATAVVLAGTAAVAVLSLGRDDPVERVESDEDALAVEDALLSPASGPTVVRGFAFVAPSGAVRLCTGIDRRAAPACVGPFIAVEGIDPNRLPVERDGAGAHTAEPVSVLGTVEGGTLRATELVGG
jgi:hypothetical protein